MARPSPPRGCRRIQIGELRGLKAPPRITVAPAAATISADRSICSRFSTLDGPAITTTRLPPNSDRKTAWFEGAAADNGCAGSSYNLGRPLDLLAVFHARWPGHHHHAAAAEFAAAHFDDRPAGAKMAAREFVWRCDAMRFLHAIHHLEHTQVELLLAAHAAEHGVDVPRRAVDVELHLHHAVNHRLDVFFGGACLHDHDHGLSPSDCMRCRCTVRASSIMRSKTRRRPSGGSGPPLDAITLANTSLSRLGS